MAECPVCYEERYLSKYDGCTHRVCVVCIVKMRGDDEVYVCPLCRRISVSVVAPCIDEAVEIVTCGDITGITMLSQYHPQVLREAVRIGLTKITDVRPPYQLVSGIITGANLCGMGTAACHGYQLNTECTRYIPYTGRCEPVVEDRWLGLVPDDVRILGLHGTMTTVSDGDVTMNLLQYIVHSEWWCDGAKLTDIYSKHLVYSPYTLVQVLAAADSIENLPEGCTDWTVQFVESSKKSPLRLFIRYIGVGTDIGKFIEDIKSITAKLRSGEPVMDIDPNVSVFIKLCMKGIYELPPQPPADEWVSSGSPSPSPSSDDWDEDDT